MLHIEKLNVGISKEASLLDPNGHDDQKNPSTKGHSTEDHLILKNFHIQIPSNSVHAIMGPNGSGKSTLSQVIMGNPLYKVYDGHMTFQKEDLLSLPMDQRARQGIFLAHQHPIEIPGLLISTFLKEAVDARRAYLGLENIDRLVFVKELKEKAKICDVNMSLLSRPLNVGLSGGEKKRLEILQMLMLDPVFMMLDEIDSGLDVDALSIIGKAIQHVRSQDKSIVIITHFSRIFQYIQPDRVHVLVKGQLVEEGDYRLAKTIEEKGYGMFVSGSSS